MSEHLRARDRNLSGELRVRFDGSRFARQNGRGAGLSVLDAGNRIIERTSPGASSDPWHMPWRATDCQIPWWQGISRAWEGNRMRANIVNCRRGEIAARFARWRGGAPLAWRYLRSSRRSDTSCFDRQIPQPGLFSRGKHFGAPVPSGDHSRSTGVLAGWSCMRDQWHAESFRI